MHRFELCASYTCSWLGDSTHRYSCFSYLLIRLLKCTLHRLPLKNMQKLQQQLRQLYVLLKQHMLLLCSTSSIGCQSASVSKSRCWLPPFMAKEVGYLRGLPLSNYICSSHEIQQEIHTVGPISQGITHGGPEEVDLLCQGSTIMKILPSEVRSAPLLLIF